MKKWKYAYPVIQEGVAADVMGWPAQPDYETVFEKLKAMGYSGIELLVRNFKTLDKGRLQDALDKYGLKLAAVGTSPMQKLDGLFLLHSDPEVRAEAEAQAFMQLTLCAEFGAFASIGKFRGSISEDPGCTWQDLASVIHRIGKEAQRLSVNVVIEAQNPSNINNLNTFEETLDWLRKMQEQNVHLHADTFHMAATEENVAKSLKTAGALSQGGEIGFVHISDTKRLVPGDGDLNFEEIYEALEEISYDGFISPEISQKPDPEIVACRSAEFFDKFN